MKRTIRAAVLGVVALSGAGIAAHEAVRGRTDVAPATVAPEAPAAEPIPAVPAAPGGPRAVTPGAPALAPNVTTAEAGLADSVVATPVSERVVYRDRVVYKTRVVRRGPRYAVRKRSGRRSAAIIGGSALGGAGLGAIVGGKKGALVGGLVGGTAGTVYDRKTRKKVVVY